MNLHYSQTEWKKQNKTRKLRARHLQVFPLGPKLHLTTWLLHSNSWHPSQTHGKLLRNAKLETYILFNIHRSKKRCCFTHFFFAEFLTAFICSFFIDFIALQSKKIEIRRSFWSFSFNVPNIKLYQFHPRVILKMMFSWFAYSLPHL